MIQDVHCIDIGMLSRTAVRLYFPNIDTHGRAFLRSEYAVDVFVEFVFYFSFQLYAVADELAFWHGGGFAAKNAGLPTAVVYGSIILVAEYDGASWFEPVLYAVFKVAGAPAKGFALGGCRAVVCYRVGFAGLVCTFGTPAARVIAGCGYPCAILEAIPVAVAHGSFGGFPFYQAAIGKAFVEETFFKVVYRFRCRYSRGIALNVMFDLRGMLC